MPRHDRQRQKRRVEVSALQGRERRMNLRHYQTNVISQFLRTTAQFKRIILVAPTGSGKSVIAAAIINEYVGRHCEVLVLAHRNEIIMQTSAKLRDLGIWHGIIQASDSTMPMAPVQIASIQTLWSRAMRKGRDGKARTELPPAKLIIVDECHHAKARTWRAIIDAYPDAIVLGLTATPCRSDGGGLGGIFETMIECPQVAELIANDPPYLVNSRVYAPANPDLGGVETRQGDYVVSQLEERMDKDKLVADIVGSWFKYGEGRKTVCFATGVGHSIHLRDEFVKAGVRAEHIDGNTLKPERDATLARLASGEIQLVTNCMVLTEGWDMPEVGTCILARPTKQMGLYRQMVGRVLRPAPGKTDAIILDHSGAVFRHGLPEDPVIWTLSEEKTARNAVHEARKGDTLGGPKILDCSQCGTIREGGKACPNCGFIPQRKPDIIIPKEGDLALVQGRKPGVAEHDKQRWFNELAGYANERGHSPWWAKYRFNDKFGHMPPSWMLAKPCTPGPEVRSWIRSRNIAYAKSLQAQQDGARP
jgi:DNA repair protein RadD